MSIEEYIKKNNLPKVKKLGKYKGWIYYIQKDLKSDMDIGVPMVIKENNTNIAVCNADEALEIIGIFY